MRLRAAQIISTVFIAVVLMWLLTGCAPDSEPGSSIRDTSIDWPEWDQIRRVITLADYNTRIVVMGTMLLGLAAGVVGTYMLLRKRALIGDAVSHATLPGIGIAFILMVQFGGSGKYLPGLLLGATITGLIGVGFILLIKGMTRIKEDAALGIVLSVFFGLGVAVLGVIQSMQQGNAAGLESFIYGKTASMIKSDVILIASVALVVIFLSMLLYKEFAILCFDQAFASAQGWPVTLIDIVMMGLVIGVSVIGLQAVGLILMIALLIIPPAAARFWTDRLWGMLIISGAVGAMSGMLGSAFSALVPRLPAGAIIVVVAAMIFIFSMIFGWQRGLLIRAIEFMKLKRKVAHQHLFRAAYECLETQGTRGQEEPIQFSSLLEARSWSSSQLRRELVRARKKGLLDLKEKGLAIRLTSAGFTEAVRVVRNHRMWELYLITHADIAPSHVDRDADQIEHVLGPHMVRKLEALLVEAYGAAMPPSPHTLTVPGSGPRGSL